MTSNGDLNERAGPLSLDDLLKAKNKNTISLKKAKFLSKSAREKIRQEQNKVVKPTKVVTSTKSVVSTEESRDDSLMKARRFTTSQKQKKGFRKFEFDWNEDEDTSSVYTPVVEFTKNVSARENIKPQDDRYWHEKSLDDMTDRDWRIMKEDYNISSKGGKVANPLRSWKESNISPLILEELEKLGYETPTPIQRAAIPMGLSGRDIVGIAETGSGKTLAFAIPIMNYIHKLPPLMQYEGPYVLVLVPTRELALQIEKVFMQFKQLRFNVASLIGGHSYDSNIEKLQKGVEVVIATPGRLLDCLENNMLSLNDCFFLAMDEADRMIDMGFEIQVNKILDQLPPGELNKYYWGEGPKKRVTMMFTATMPPQIERMTSAYLDKPGIVMIGEVGEAVDTVVQDAMLIPTEEKRLVTLESILSQFPSPIIIFANFKKTCETISEYLEARYWKTIVMHGSKTQEQRESAIKQMKSGAVDILIATDVAGRGIDIPDVSVVINFQMSRTIEDYTHRIGRTGRAGKNGTAITFWGPEDADVLYALKTMISKSPVSKCPESLRNSEYAQKTTFRKIEE